MAKHPKNAGPGKPRRDPAADRALFEQALEQLDPSAGDKQLDDADRDRESLRRARFSRRIERGEIEPAATVDLHGLDRETAASRLRRFLSAAAGDVVLVIHGRGAGILQQVAIDELDRHPAVAEHVSAPRHLGGDGARLARLRRRP